MFPPAANMGTHVKPGDQLAACRASVLFNLLAEPLRDAGFSHAQRTGDNRGMIADAVDDWPCAEFSQLFTGKIVAGHAKRYFSLSRKTGVKPLRP